MTAEAGPKKGGWPKGEKRGAFTDETRAKMSRAKLGKKRSPFTVETRAKLSAAQLGKTHTAETRAKMSASHRANIAAGLRARRERDGAA